MLARIPTLLPDETLYSYAKRCAEYNYMPIRHLETIHMGGQRLHGDGLLYLSPLKKLTEGALDDQLTVLMSHTMYPLVSLYSRRIEQSFILASLSRPAAPKRLLTPLRSCSSGEMICPACLQDDIRAIGDWYYHRKHQIPGVTACPIHGTVLHMSTDPLKDPTPAKPEDTAYARYMASLLDLGLDAPYEDTHRVLVEKLRDIGYQRSDHLDSLIDSMAQSGSFRRTNRPTRRGAHGLISEAHYLSSALFLRAVPFCFPTPKDFADALQGAAPSQATIPGDKSEYTVISSSMSGNTVEMLHATCGRSYLTSSYGFQAGWTCPVCDQRSDEDIFSALFCYEAQGEYELLSPFKGMLEPVMLRHLRCHGISPSFQTTPRHFLIEGRRCACGKSLSHEEADRAVRQKGDFKLIHFTRTSAKAKIMHTACGKTFEHHYVDFLLHPWCRACVPYSPDEEFFRREMYDLVGDEYKLVGPYSGRGGYVDIRHQNCGKLFRRRAIEFLRGTRCPYCRRPVPDKDLAAYVSLLSSGRYRVDSVDSRTAKCRVVDTRTGKERVMDKYILIQELRRPSPGDLLPFDPSTRYDGLPLTASEHMATELYLKLSHKTTFTTKDIITCTGLPPLTVNKITCACRKDGLLLGVDRGQFTWPSSVLIKEILERRDRYASAERRHQEKTKKRAGASRDIYPLDQDP